MGMIKGGLKALADGNFWEKYKMNKQARITLTESFMYRFANFDYPLDICNFKMYLNPKDKGLSRQLWARGFREPVCTAEYTRLLKKCHVVFDIGSNIGYYPLIASKAKKIFCFEPVPDNFKYLITNLYLNKLMKKCNCYNSAIAPDDATYGFVKTEHLNRSYVTNNKSEECNDVVTGINLDNFCNKTAVFPTVVRMDIEGYEYKIMPHMKWALQDCKHMFIELHPYLIKKNYHGNYWDVMKILENLGLEPYLIVKEYGAFAESSYPTNVEDLYNDLFKIGVVDEDYKSGFGLFLRRQ